MYAIRSYYVKAGDLLATWDPFTTPIISEVDGTVKFGDIIAGQTMLV